MILVNNTLVQGQHDFYKRAGITLSEKNNEEQNPVLNPENPVLNPDTPGAGSIPGAEEEFNPAT